MSTDANLTPWLSRFVSIGPGFRSADAHIPGVLAGDPADERTVLPIAGRAAAYLRRVRLDIGLVAGLL